MEIPINAEVFCEDQLCGRSTMLIINPVNKRVTHVVVAEHQFPNLKRLVPVAEIEKTTTDEIRLRCSQEDFSQMDSYEETDFLEMDESVSVMPYDMPYRVWPFGLYDMEPMPLAHENIPPGELAIHRGMPVKATDGRVGRVDEFIINPKTEAISHLVLREGHLWGEKDVTIPVSAIASITEDAVLLKLSKKNVGDLPAVQVKRWWK
jgi:uncharacterized protein YrrD